MKMTMMMVMLRKFRIFAHETGNQTLFKPRFFFALHFNFHGIIMAHVIWVDPKKNANDLNDRTTDQPSDHHHHHHHPFLWMMIFFCILWKKNFNTHTHTKHMRIWKVLLEKKSTGSKTKNFQHTHIPDIQSKSKNFRIFIYFLLLLLFIILLICCCCCLWIAWLRIFH